MRRVALVLMTVGLVVAAAPAAQAAEARVFSVTGTTGSLTAGEVAETRSGQAGAPNDRQRIEARLTWRIVKPRRRAERYATLAVPRRARKGSRAGRSRAMIPVRVQLTVTASGETWVRNAPATTDLSGRYETWSCAIRRTIGGLLPVSVVARGGPRFELRALPATGFAVGANGTSCTESHPAALPSADETLSFGGPRLGRALTVARRLRPRELRAGRSTLALRQEDGPVADLDCRSDVAPVCTQTATASGTLRLRKRRG